MTTEPDFVRTSGHFDVDAVMWKWGFTYYNATFPLWQGWLDGKWTAVLGNPRDFATLLLMRN